jgi:hypothetical protein
MTTDRRATLDRIVSEINRETGEEWSVLKPAQGESERGEVICEIHNLNPADFRIVKLEIPPNWYEEVGGREKIRAEILAALRQA